MKVLVTGFGPFEDVDDNASGRLAERLHGRHLVGDGRALAVHGVALPTAFGAARARIGALIAGLEPAVVVCLGVARGPELRLERRAGCVVTSARPDAVGEVWGGRRLGSSELACDWPLERWAELVWARVRGLEVRASDDCGGYVCNAAYHAALEAQPEGALFVHLPREAMPGSVTGGLVEEAVVQVIELAVGERMRRLEGLSMAGEG